MWLLRLNGSLSGRHVLLYVLKKDHPLFNKLSQSFPIGRYTTYHTLSTHYTINMIYNNYVPLCNANNQVDEPIHVEEAIDHNVPSEDPTNSVVRYYSMLLSA